MRDFIEDNPEIFLILTIVLCIFGSIVILSIYDSEKEKEFLRKGMCQVQLLGTTDKAWRLCSLIKK